MSTEIVYAASSVSGSATNPNNAIGSTTGNWAGTTNSNTSWTHTWAMTAPVRAFDAGSQTVTVRARKGSNSGNPSVTVNIYRGGTLLGGSGGSVTVTSTSGQDVVASFIAGQGDPSSGIQVEVVVTAAGGSPSARNSVEVDYIRLNANIEDPPAPPIANAGVDFNIEQGQSNVLDGSASTLNGASAQWHDITGGGNVYIGLNVNQMYTFNNAGVRTFRLTLVNSTGSSTDTVDVTVTPPAPKPKIETLVEDFSDESQFNHSGNGDSFISGNDLFMSRDGALLSQVTFTQYYDVNDSSIVFVLSGDQLMESNSLVTFLLQRSAVSTRMQFEIGSSNIYGRSYTLGSQNEFVTAANPGFSGIRYFRIRESAGQLFFEAFTGGQWVSQLSFAHGLTDLQISEMTLSISAECTSGDLDPLEVYSINLTTPSPPVLVFGGSSATSVGTSAVLTASGSSDPDGLIVSYEFVQTSGPAVTLSGTGTSRSFTPTVDGDYEFRATITDNDGLTATGLRTITVYVRPTAVVAEENVSTQVGTPVTLDASGSYSYYGQSISYQWEMDDYPNGASGTFSDDLAAVTQFTPDTVGIYGLFVSIADENGGDSAYVYVDSTEQPPTPLTQRYLFDGANLIPLGTTVVKE